jgi:hypothetical protein
MGQDAYELRIFKQLQQNPIIWLLTGGMPTRVMHDDLQAQRAKLLLVCV